MAVEQSSSEPAREQGSVDQVANGRRRHSAVAEKVIDARIDRNHGVEDAGLRVDVELNQDLRLLGGHRSVRSAGEGVLDGVFLGGDLAQASG